MLGALLCLGLLATPARAEIYEWIDEGGRRHFTDDLNRVPEAERARMRVSPGPGAGAAVSPPASRDPGPAPAERAPTPRARLARDAARQCAARIPPDVRLHIDAEGTLAVAGDGSASAGGGLEAFLDCFRRASRAAQYAQRPFCFDGAVAVPSRWDGALRRLFDKLWAVASAEIEARDVALAVVDGPPILPNGGARGDGERATIVVSLDTLRQVQSWGEPEWAIVRVIAHELAHLALHQDPAASQAGDPTTREYEADELGIYYFEQAGYDCRTWVNAIGPLMVARYDTADNQRRALGAACDLAKQGLRPPRRLAGG
jgi:hypothetical protein